MRKYLLIAHLVIGAFFIPMGIMFAVTGGLYTWGVKGEYETKTVDLTPPAPVGAELEPLVALANEILKVENLAAPTGSPSVKKAGTSWQFEWTGSHLDLIIEPTANPEEVRARIKRTTPHRFFVQLHKAKGGVVFKILAGAFALGLILLFVSGMFLAQAQPRYARVWYVSAGLGVVSFILAAFVS